MTETIPFILRSLTWRAGYPVLSYPARIPRSPLPEVVRDPEHDPSLTFRSQRDIGATAAKAMVAAEVYRNAEINLAGDNLTFEEASRIFGKETWGKKSPTANKFLTWILVVPMKDAC
ncbi:hypothetical protein V1522DRAFT_449751 [Lipomyces starkeyi]